MEQLRDNREWCLEHERWEAEGHVCPTTKRHDLRVWCEVHAAWEFSPDDCELTGPDWRWQSVTRFHSVSPVVGEWISIPVAPDDDIPEVLRAIAARWEQEEREGRW